MAYKTLAFIVLNIVLIHASDTDPEEPCLCMKDEASVWKFLQALSVDVPEEEKGIYAVVPGELSPLAECDCESDRRKRKVLKSDDAPVDMPPEVASSPEDDSADQRVRAKKSLKRGSCPDGQVKVGPICVNEDTFDY